MIVVRRDDIKESDFLSLLEKTKSNIISDFSTKMPKKMNGVEFEGVVFDSMTNSSKKTIFEGYIEQTGKNSFPDIIARKIYGVEVKMTESDKWQSTGNSVLESTRIDSVESIYMFFGKFGNKFDIKYRKYQECLQEIGVTHSPRYKIDMDLDAGNSIFDKMNIDYDKFRNTDNPISIVKDYYRKQLKSGEELWWIDSSSEEPAVSPVIKSFTTLDRQLRDKFIVESFILFPEIFGTGSVKFERTAAYLITNFNAVSSSLRDHFTAGGRTVIKIKNKNVEVSRLVYNLYLNSKGIEEAIKNISNYKLETYWKIKFKGNPLLVWRSLINHYSSEGIDLFDVFLEGKKL